MVAAASTFDHRAHSKRFADLILSRPLWPALLLVALISALRSTGTVDSDVAWQLWIAGRIHAGARLYTDIIELNPPLWFWMAVPVDRLAALLHIRIEAALVAAMGGAVALSLAAANRLLSRMAPPRRTFLLAYGALVLAAMPWAHVGQREQIVLIATFPYCVLVAERRKGNAIHFAFAAAIGVGAALGFALKQYFLIVPVLLELWLLSGQRSRWRPLRPETLAVAATGFAYAAALILFEPAFLTRIVPLIRLAYGDFGAPRITDLLGPFALTGLGILWLAVWQLASLRGRKAEVSASLTIAAGAFAAVYFIQSKGWAYHSIPLIGCGSLGLAALLAEIDQPSRILRIASPAVLLFPIILSAEETLHQIYPGPDLIAATSGLSSGDSVGFLATESAVPWSVTLQGGYRYASRYDGFWMLGAITNDERRRVHDPRLAQLGRQVVDDTIADFACAPPKRIIVSRPRKGESAFDILPFFLRNPRFARLLSHYRERSRSKFETFEITSPLDPPKTQCRQGV